MYAKPRKRLRLTSNTIVFDLEAIWEEHTYFEFEVRSVAKTMGTMVVGSMLRSLIN